MANAAAVDFCSLWYALGPFCIFFVNRDLLNEQPQQLRCRFRDIQVSFRFIKEAGRSRTTCSLSEDSLPAFDIPAACLRIALEPERTAAKGGEVFSKLVLTRRTENVTIKPIKPIE